MGILDFLKKKPEDTGPTPNASPVTRSDEKLTPLEAPVLPPPSTPRGYNAPPPLLPPVLPPQKESAEPMRVEQMSVPVPTPQPLPPLPKLDVPKPQESQKPVPPIAPKPVLAQTAPKLTLDPSDSPFITAKEPLRQQVDALPPLSKPISTPTLPARPEPKSFPKEGKLGMPQVTPPIKSERKEGSQLPVSELRQVIRELREIPLNLPPEPTAVPDKKPEPVKKAPEVSTDNKPLPKQAFIPAERFDEGILTIRAVMASLSAMQGNNERLGAIETAEKTAADTVAAACETIHATLLKMDEKLFQVK